MRVERLREDFDLQFDVCAFDLRPGIPPEGIPREEAAKGRVYPPGYVDSMRQMALDSGIEMKRPPVIPNTRQAHEATEFAREEGRLMEFHDAVFEAYWVREENIGELDVLIRVAIECGLDAARLREALEDGRYAARVQEQMEWAHAAGINGVPTIILEDKFAIVGAQDYETYLDAGRRIASGRV